MHCDHQFDSVPDSEWDELLAETLRGARVVGTLTYANAADEVERQTDFYGRIASVERTGIVIALEGSRTGETINLPPALDWFAPARPGKYRLPTTGELVIDPEYVVGVQVTRPADN
jgi:hypothetical protein